MRFSREFLTGQKVRLEADSSQDERDKYGRLLRYVFLEDGRNFNKLMVTEGYAYEYTYDNPYKYQAEFQNAETGARNAGRGLWSASTCNGTTQTVQTTQQQTKNNQIQDVSSVPSPVKSAPQYTGGDKDCGHFATHAEAQSFYVSQGGPGSDPHRLDRDGDGLACETLP